MSKKGYYSDGAIVYYMDNGYDVEVVPVKTAAAGEGIAGRFITQMNVYVTVDHVPTDAIEDASPEDLAQLMTAVAKRKPV